MSACASCGASNPERFRFCGTCGAALSAEPQTSQVRKVVTVLFVDVTGSTELGERVDPEALRRAMGRYFALARDVIERHGGTVEKFIGDAVMAVFGIPQVHEDDALRAARAAVEVRDALADLNEQMGREQGIQISVRIGLNTGEVVAGEGERSQTLVTGDAVNTAARLEEAAAPGEIVIGAATFKLVGPLTTSEPLPDLTVKGKQSPIRAYRLMDAAPQTATAPRRLEGPMVGRQDELQQLDSVLKRVISERRCHLFTIVGGAGVGKSRLVREFVAGFGARARVLRGRCLPYGDGITYWPIMEIAREAAAIEPIDSADAARDKLQALATDPQVAESVASAIGLSQERSGTEQIAWGVRKLFEGIAGELPLVVIIDDIQWAEPVLLDLIEEVANWTQDAPLMLVCMARTELHDERPTWSGGVLNSTTVLLDPLPADESSTLIRNLVGESVLRGALGRRIVETAEGNPLFVEEMIGMLVDAGVLTRDGEGWQLNGDLDRVEVPPTIQALLAARLDRLPPAERAVAQRGSVIGRTFEQLAVSELSPEADRSQIVSHLRGLVRHQVIGPYQADDIYRFRHLLIRDAAYEALPKEERAELHERFADWLEAVAGDRMVENEEILGYHLEQAHDYRHGLGQRHDRVTELARRSGAWLAAAGDRAEQRQDIRAAQGLLTRAVRLLPAGHARYWPAHLKLASVLVDAGDLGAASDLYLSIAEDPEDVPDELRVEARLVHAWVETDRGRLSSAGTRRAIGEALCAATRGNHHRIASRAWFLAAGLYQNSLDVPRAERALKRAARHADLADDPDGELDTLLALAGLGSRSLMPVSEAMAFLDRALAIPGLSRAQRGRVEESRAYLLGLQGRFDEARDLMAEEVRELTELGRLEGLSAVSTTFGLIEFFAERYTAAREHFVVSRDLSDQSGRAEWSRFMAGRLAHIYMLEGDDEAALANVEIVKRSHVEGGDIEWWGELFASGAEARILARRGHTAEAVERARQMIAVAEDRGFRDYPVVFAPALEDLAEVLAADGQTQEACAVLNREIAIHRAKENAAGLAKAE